MRKIDLKLVDGEYENPLKNAIHHPEDISRIFRSLKDKASETLLVIYLQHDLTGIYDVHSTGPSGTTVFDAQDLFGRAYVTRSRYMILVHNHPSGDATPSPEDLQNLSDILALAKPMRSISLLDFIIIGEDDIWSWFEENEGGDYTQGALNG